MLTLLSLHAALLGCSNDFPGKTADPVATEDDTGPVEDTAPQDTGRGDPRMDCADAPAADVVPTESTCTYTPSSGSAGFSARVEWSMAHGMTDPADSSVTHDAWNYADSPDKSAVFQAPAVVHLTDDNGDGSVGARRPGGGEDPTPWRAIRVKISPPPAPNPHRRVSAAEHQTSPLKGVAAAA